MIHILTIAWCVATGCHTAELPVPGCAPMQQLGAVARWRAEHREVEHYRWRCDAGRAA